MTNAERLFKLFHGLENAHGEYRITGLDAKKNKIGGRAKTIPSPVTLELWEQHLAGEVSIGVVPICLDNTCRWGAIDIDDYELDHVKIDALCAKLQLPVIVCTTKSGGAHVLAFFNEPVPAKIVHDKLNEWATALGYPNIEIFPKQIQITSDNDCGNWLNMPYFGGSGEDDDSERYAVESGSGKPMSLGAFIDYAEMIAMSKEDIDRINVLESTDELLEGAPPCIKYLALSGFDDGSRNDGLFAVGVFLKKKFPDEWKSKLYDFNVRYMKPQLYPPEVMQTEGSLARKDYQYPCKKEPIASHCDKTACKKCAFGVGKGSADDAGTLEVVIGDLVKLDGDPPIWQLNVNAHRLDLTTEELMGFSLFKKKCLEKLTLYVGTIKQAQWELIYSDKVQTAEVQAVPEDAGTLGQFKIMVQHFLTGRTSGKSRDDLLNGVPFFDEDGEENKDKTPLFYFRSQDFEAYLSHRHFFSYKTTEIYSHLKDMGADPKGKQFNIKGSCVRCWTMPNIFESQNQEFDVPVEKGEDMS